jgi:acetyl esterase/lipase
MNANTAAAGAMAPAPTDPEVHRFPSSAGDREQRRAILDRNEALRIRFGADRRAAYAAMSALTPLASSVDVAAVSDAEARGWWVRPSGARPGRCILFIHGGGYHLGDAQSYRGFASQLAVRARCDVFVMDYPLAPEHRFPAAYEAAAATLDWIGSNDGRRVALVGDSAGGALALGLLGGSAPAVPVASVVAFSPWTDLSLGGASFADPATRDPVFSRDVLGALASSYLAGADPRDPRASPLFGVPARPPPLLLQVGSDELLLDDSREYARRAAGRGARVVLEIYDDMHHVFQRDVEGLQSARDALDRAAAFVSSHWCIPCPPSTARPSAPEETR